MDNQQRNGADVSMMREQLDSLTREVKYISMQSTSMFEKFEDKLTALKREFSYLNQQNQSVYNMTTGFVEEALKKTQTALEEKIAVLHEAIATMDDDGSVIPAVEVVVDHDRIAEGVARKLSDKNRKGGESEEEEEVERMGMDDIDYDTLAEKVAENIPPVDYDYLALKIANNMAAADSSSLADEVAQKVIENMPKDEDVELDVSPEAIAESVVARMQDTVLNLNTESLAESVADKVVTGISTMDTEGFACAVAEKVAGETLSDVTVDTDAVVAALVTKLQDTTLELDVDNLASSLAERIQVPPLEVDVQELAANIAEKIDLSGVKVDVDELAENIAARIEPAQTEIDYDLVAERILEALPEVDYDTMSASLAEKLNGNEEDVETYLAEHGLEVDVTDSSDRVITAVEENGDKTNALVEEVLAILKSGQFVAVAEEEEPVEEPVQELVDEPEEEVEVVEEVVAVVEEPVQETVDEVSIAEAMAETAAMAEEAEDAGKALRLKRSYECKLRQSEDDVKYYYSEIKNELLSYGRVKSSISWNGDRFNLGRDTIAKIGINGKTLCLYLALNPDEYSITKYHQKYVGDVKAYESTPMMLKVKSSMGLKKAIALIIEMMEGMKATRKHVDPVDYAAEFSYKSDEQLIAEGLIKVSITEKKDLQSF